ncbi:1-acyl-sn-glycerol-3-phosphate acyltransferase [Enhygromyxa salina]|uniref:1-acyl-sn-glycerol-3-phosphate acyltransferase n=1 Tax=Enhygromyxa salina TaxID=215803 RepID=A0A2S9YCG4_9BACT|nr:lysophospholipid acyltransferase family protein [Enhygromyxa salina]PRQ02800.1 1-acyl-sn-glycerol-3-phosphate acyltransferase [Enhygromyxa salina]
MPRFLRIPLSGLAFLVFYGGAAVIAWILLPLKRRRIRHLPPAEQREALDRFMMRCYRFSIEFMSALGLMHFSLPDFERAELPPPPWVIVANHPSLLDVLFIKAALPGVAVLVKSALFKAPSLRRLFEASGDFKGPEQRDQSFGSTAVLDIFVDCLRSGRSVLVFPEGTRSPAWRMHRFRRGAAEAAIRADVPIVPVFVISDPPTLKKGDKWYDMPSRVPRFELELLPAINPKGRSSRELTAELRDQLAERLEAARIAATKRPR